jgi:hypothetical protein
MAKSRYISFCLLFLLCITTSSLGNDCLTQKLDRQLGVRESGGNNQGWKVAQYLESVGLGPGYAWCAAYVHWSLEQCGINTPITAWSPTAFNPKNVVYLHGKFKKPVKVGDVFVLYSIKSKRIVHTGFVREIINEKFYMSNEGNAARDGALNPYDGDGVYEKIRSFNATYGISRWN